MRFERVKVSALELYWTGGFAGTSLDDLREATGLNRPSLYAAFGDKQAIFLKAADQFRTMMRARQMEALRRGKTPVEGVTRFLLSGVEIYVSGGGRGCMVMSTTAVEAVEDESVRTFLRATLAEIRAGLNGWLRHLVDEGALRDDTDTDLVAWQIESTSLSLGIHARAGSPRSELAQLARKSARALLSPLLS